jgi:hypothetical protein
MGREIKRVALDFDWPLNKVWEGFLNPFYKYMHKCKFCDGTGGSKRANELSDMWYSYVEFNPEDNGSKPFTPETPAIRDLATRNAFHMEFTRFMDFDTGMEYYRKNKDTLKPSKNYIDMEAKRLCDQCYNNWSHHLSQDDVDALIEAGRLHDFTHTWTSGKGWEVKNPPYHPTAQEVNEWSLYGGHDSINQWVCVKARCKREKVSNSCSHCKGEGSVWESKEYKKKADKWKQVQPKEGKGFQIWETVSEGSPVSPVFEKPEDLAHWMVDNDNSITKNTTFEQWYKFITETKWAPSGVMINGVMKSGVEM